MKTMIDGEVRMAKYEYDLLQDQIKTANKRIEALQKALFQFMTNEERGTNETMPVVVAKSDFLALYDMALSAMMSSDDDNDNDIYGQDVMVSWHGISCNCGDGAVACNNIIEGVREVLEEDGDY